MCFFNFSLNAFLYEPRLAIAGSQIIAQNNQYAKLCRSVHSNRISVSVFAIIPTTMKAELLEFEEEFADKYDLHAIGRAVATPQDQDVSRYLNELGEVSFMSRKGHRHVSATQEILLLRYRKQNMPFEKFVKDPAFLRTLKTPGQTQKFQRVMNGHIAHNKVAAAAREQGDPNPPAFSTWDTIFLQQNAQLIPPVATRDVGGSMTYRDRINEGFLGLHSALGKYDPRGGNLFSTYAVHWIRQAITRSVANTAKTIRTPVYKIQEETELRKERDLLTQELGHVPAQEELADDYQRTHPCVSIEKARERVMFTQQPASLDEELVKRVGGEDDPSLTLADMIRAENDEITLTPEDIKTILRELAKAAGNERNYRIMLARWGIGYSGGKKLKDVAKEFGTSHQNIHLIEKNILYLLSQSEALRNLMQGIAGYDVEYDPESGIYPDISTPQDKRSSKNKSRAKPIENTPENKDIVIKGVDLTAYWNQLSPIEQHVLSLRFGLRSEPQLRREGEMQTYDEMADALSLPQQTIWNIENKVFKRFSDKVGKNQKPSRERPESRAQTTEGIVVFDVSERREA